MGRYSMFFTDSGVPRPGLTPTIIVYRVIETGVNLGNPPIIEDLGDGFYKFTDSPTEPRVILVDGGEVLSRAADRYKGMEITQYDEAIDAAVSTRSTSAQADLIYNQVTSAPKVVLPAMQGRVYAVTALQDRIVRIVRSDTPTIYFQLFEDGNSETPKNCTGFDAFFEAKIKYTETESEYSMQSRQVVFDSITLGTGHFDLSSVDTSKVGLHYGKIILKQALTKITAMQYTIMIVP